MKKGYKLLLTFLYFITTISWLFILFFSEYFPYVEAAAIYSFIGVGCLYSFFIVTFLFTFNESGKSTGLGFILLLSATWILLFQASLFLGIMLSVFLRGLGSIIIMFLSTLVGTYLFLKILSKWEKFPKIKPRNLSLKFASLAAILSLPLLETDQSLRTIPLENIFLISIVWQIIMTYYLWKKMQIPKSITSDMQV